jgi:hypothetical protein
VITGRARIAWLLPVATFVGAILLGLGSCDSDRAFVAGSFLAAVTGVLGGGLLFIHRGRPAETIPQLFGAAIAALLVAVPLAGISFVAMLVVAVVHCGLD